MAFYKKTLERVQLEMHVVGSFEPISGIKISTFVTEHGNKYSTIYPETNNATPEVENMYTDIKKNDRLFIDSIRILA